MFPEVVDEPRQIEGISWKRKQACAKETEMNNKIYEYEAVIRAAEQKGGAYVPFPYDIREEFGRGRVRKCAPHLTGRRMTAAS